MGEPGQYATLDLSALYSTTTSADIAPSTSTTDATSTASTGTIDVSTISPLIDQPPSSAVDTIPSLVPSSTTTEESSAAASATNTLPAQYAHFDKGEYWDPNKADTAITQIAWTDLDGFPYETLCQPSGNCAQECLNTTRLYAGHPTDVVLHNGNNFTLFEICSNLGDLSYYNNTAVGDPSDQDLLKISANLGSCLPSTCETSRKPQDCSPACSLNGIFDGTVVSSSAHVWGCMVMLCANTCGLPYLDADVMGVGVIASYIVQACLISLCATYVLWKTLLPTKRRVKSRSSSPRVDMSTERVMEDPSSKEHSFVSSTTTFLVAQCFLGIALQIAVLYSKPWSTDPLTGLGLLFAVIIGFLPPVFTLLLLHTQHAKSWFTWLLTFLTWGLSTANLFLLTSQLFTSPKDIAAVSNSALEHANDITTCGGTSALALCSLVVGRNPLEWVASLYSDARADTYPNLRSIYVIWVYSTVTFAALTTSQLRRPDHRVSTSTQYTSLHKQSIAVPNGGFFSDHHNNLYRWTTHWTVFLAAFFMFLFGTLYYQAGMLYQLSRMDVLDWDGWSFGQIAAVTVWVPVVVEYVHNLLLEWA